MENTVEFIAEIGLNHNGNLNLIPELIRQAGLSGANFAKFQLGWRDNPDEINCLAAADIELICKYCRFYGLEPLFSVFHEKALATLLDTSYSRDVVKVASRTLSDAPGLVSKLGSYFDRVIVSTGMVDKTQPLDFGISGAEYLWCMSEYPLHPFNIKDFPTQFSRNSFFGISDHSQGDGLTLISVSRGARLVERHFTLDKSDSTIRDHALSSTPEEFRQLVIKCNEIARVLPHVI